MTEEDWRDFDVLGQDELSDEDAWYVLNFDEAREAAEYHAIMHDLEFVAEACDTLEYRLLRWEEQGSEPYGVEERIDRSLWIAAVTTYGRCFLPGVRANLHDSLFIESTGADHRPIHHYFMNIRSKHVAHPINRLETHETVVSLHRRVDGSLLTGAMKTVHASLAHPHHSDVQRLGKMASIAIEDARERYEDANRRTLDKIEDLSQDELSRMRRFTFRRQEGFISPESAQAMEKARRGRDRKAKRGKT